MAKKINISIVILSIIETVCYFTPLCLSQEYWKYEKSTVYHGVAALKSRSYVNFFKIGSELGQYLAILLFCTAIIAIVAHLLKIMNCYSGISKKAWVASVAHTVAMILFLIYSCGFAEVERISYHYSYSISWMSYVVIATNIISCILAIVLRFGKTNLYSHEQNRGRKEKQTDSLDELLTYKELLDIGVLTAEEFEEKKKQLLDL